MPLAGKHYSALRVTGATLNWMGGGSKSSIQTPECCLPLLNPCFLLQQCWVHLILINLLVLLLVQCVWYTIRNLSSVGKKMQALSKLSWPADGWGWVGKYPLVDFPVALAGCTFLFPVLYLIQYIFIHALLHHFFCSVLVPSVGTCSHAFLAVPAFLLGRAPPSPAPLSSLLKLLLLHQWSSRSCWG